MQDYPSAVLAVLLALAASNASNPERAVKHPATAAHHHAGKTRHGGVGVVSTRPVEPRRP